MVAHRARGMKTGHDPGARAVFSPSTVATSLTEVLTRWLSTTRAHTSLPTRRGSLGPHHTLVSSVSARASAATEREGERNLSEMRHTKALEGCTVFFADGCDIPHLPTPQDTPYRSRPRPSTDPTSRRPQQARSKSDPVASRLSVQRILQPLSRPVTRVPRHPHDSCHPEIRNPCTQNRPQTR